MLSVSMPKSRDPLRVGADRDEVLGHRGRRRAPSPASSQLRASVALVSVSWVVNVLETTTNSVLAGSRSCGLLVEVGRVDVGDEPALDARVRYAFSASYAITGPRSDPPMPMLTTVLIRSPVWPGPLAGAHPLAERRPSGRAPRARRRPRPGRPRRATRPRGRRSAVCSTARSSVTLMCSPGEHRRDPLAQPGPLGERDQRGQDLVGDQVLAVVHVQVRRPRAVSRSPRCASLANRSRRCMAAHASACLRSACHSSVVVTSTAIGSIFSFTTGGRPAAPANPTSLPPGPVARDATRRRSPCRRVFRPPLRDTLLGHLYDTPVTE